MGKSFSKGNFNCDLYKNNKELIDCDTLIGYSGTELIYVAFFNNCNNGLSVKHYLVKKFFYKRHRK